MSTDLLFEQFATLATAPDGIARLRELILQLAVQGKLGTQEAGDEPASVLFEKILKERKLAANKKTSLVISNEEFPFEIPENWIFTKVGDISQIIRGITYKKGDEIPFPKENFVPILRSNNINKGINFEKLVYLPRNFVDEQKWLRLGDLVVAMSSGSANLVGKTAQIEKEFEGSIGAFCGIIRPTPLILRGYLKYFFQCPYYRSVVSEFGQGIGINNLGTNNLQNILIPLPPLTEQHRIVAKVDRLMALCDELEARQILERAGCLKLGTASLAAMQNADSPEEFERQWAQVCDAFELILDCPENVAVLRQTILQLAVQGRLVRQEPGDEPAGKLVERIRKEKERLVNEGTIKRERPLDPFDRSTPPYKIPKSWTFEYLNDLCELVADPDHNMPKAVEKGVKFISSKDLNDEGIVNFERNVKLISEEDYSRLARKLQPKKGDILFARIGARIGKPCIVTSDERFMISYSCCVIRPLLVDTRFINYYLKEASFLAVALQKTVGVGVPDLGMKMIKQFVVPVPPMAEQHRIVAKVDALMALCDALELRLKERAGVQGRLAGAVVKDIATSN